MAAVRFLPVAALGLVLALAPACSDDDPAPREADSSPSASGSALPSDDDLQAYFGAVASYDRAALEAAEPVAADGSPALDYLHYQEAYAASSEAGGHPLPSAEATATDDGFEACLDAGAGRECATWSDLEGAGGRLVDFSVNGSVVGDVLRSLAGQPPISPDGLFTWQPTWSYRSASQQVLFVLADLTAGASPVTLRPESAIYVEQTVQLTGADDVRGPRTVDAGQTLPVILAFPDAGDAALDGAVTVTVEVEGRPQSIGFELAS